MSPASDEMQMNERKPISRSCLLSFSFHSGQRIERSVRRVERKHRSRFDSHELKNEVGRGEVSESTNYGQAHKRVEGPGNNRPWISWYQWDEVVVRYRGISGKRGGKVRDQHPLDSRGLQNSHTVNDSFRNITQIFLRLSSS